MSGVPLVMAPMALLGMLGSVVRPPLQAFVPQPSPRARPTAGEMAAWHGPLVQPASPPTLLLAPMLPPVQPTAAVPRASAWKRNMNPSAPPL